VRWAGVTLALSGSGGLHLMVMGEETACARCVMNPVQAGRACVCRVWSGNSVSHDTETTVRCTPNKPAAAQVTAR
jgi:hypothetical protein